MTSLAHKCRAVLGDRGAVSAAHPLAVEAGVGALLAGGSAMDAALAAQSVVCTLMPQAAGLGGDMLALVRSPEGVVTAVNGMGFSPHAGFPSTPGRAATAAGADITVPGLVHAWSVCHDRWCRLPLTDLLAPAVRLARGGAPVDEQLMAAIDAQRSRLVAGGAESWPLLRCSPGESWYQLELADLLGRVGTEGPGAFYAGESGAAVVGAARAFGGLLTAADLSDHETHLTSPVSVAWAGGMVHVQPPMSQGVLLALSLVALESGHVRWSPGKADHLLVELTEAAFMLRSSCGRGNSLLTSELTVDDEVAQRRGGGRAYLHTAAVAAADALGTVVSSLVSVFDDFGSAVFVPELGLVLNNRAAGFTDGANAPAAHTRPVHTLAPALVDAGNGAVLALATPGADGQIQTLLQVLCRQRYTGAPLHEALAAPRWRSEGGRLMVESGHLAAASLRERGHDVVLRPAGEDRFGAVAAAGLAGGSPWAAADWRRSLTAGAA